MSSLSLWGIFVTIASAMAQTVFSSNFYFALRFLPKEKRQAMFMFYRFCRVVDDVVDLAKDNGNAQAELTRWKKEVALCYEGEPSHPIAVSLKSLIQHYQIPRQDIEDLLAGVEMDLVPRRFANFNELEQYCYRVASVVGLVCLRIFGCQHSDSRQYAIYLGKALQLTNILRDLKQDADQGRVYIPQNELARFGYPENSLLQGVYNDSFVDLMQFQCQRARAFFEQAQARMPEQDLRNLFPARIMGEIYQRILDRIDQCRYNVFDQRVSLPLGEKLLIAIKHRVFRSLTCE